MTPLGRIGSTAFLVGMGLSVAIFVPPSRPVAAADDRRARPNILVIVTDDQRADALAAMPSTRELFIEGGSSFSHAYATTPLCCPSRASLMTGRYAHNHHVRSGEELSSLSSIQEKSIQKSLSADGYKTAFFGKYLNDWPLRKNPRYLNRWAIIPNSKFEGYRDGRWNISGKIRRVERYSTVFLRDISTRWLRRMERADDKPWALFISTTAPHFPYEPQRRYATAKVGRWEGNPAVGELDRSDKPVWVQERSATFERGRRLRAKQLRTLMSVDDLVAGVFDTLRSLGERDTLAIYTSDNGYMWGEHGLQTKRFPYLQSVQIPLLARWPGHISKGSMDRRIVANIDVAPTIADATGVSFGGFDGRSLLSEGERDRLLLEFWLRTGRTDPVPDWAATLTMEDHYIEYYNDESVVVEHELYDLVSDPWQLTNVMGDDDLTNDPSPIEIGGRSLQLMRDRSCKKSDCP